MGWLVCINCQRY